MDREVAREIGVVVVKEEINDGRTEEGTGTHGWGGGGGPVMKLSSSTCGRRGREKRGWGGRGAGGWKWVQNEELGYSGRVDLGKLEEGGEEMRQWADG